MRYLKCFVEATKNTQKKVIETKNSRQKHVGIIREKEESYKMDNR